MSTEDEPQTGRDPFLPDDPLQMPVELGRDREACAPGTLVDELPLPMARKRITYKIPRTYAIVGIALAMVGLVTVSRWLWKLYSEQSALTATEVDQMLAPKVPVYSDVQKANDSVLVQIEVHPADSRLFIDGKPIESNPVRVSRGQRVLKLTAWKSGFAQQELEFIPSENLTLKVRMKPENTPTR